MDSSFELFGTGHLLAMIATITLAAAAAGAGRQSPAIERGLRYVLAGTLAAIAAGALATLAARDALRWVHLVPLQLSDFAVVLAVLALLTRWRPACEVLYFWGLTGVFFAKVMPAVREPFPDPVTATYFALHGLVVVAAALLTFGSRVQFAPGAHWRALAFTAGYAAFVGLVNAITGANFLFLRRPPPEPTLLDYFGPWPVYIVVVAAIAAVSFWLLARVAPTGTRRG